MTQTNNDLSHTDLEDYLGGLDANIVIDAFMEDGLHQAVEASMPAPPGWLKESQADSILPPTLDIDTWNEIQVARKYRPTRIIIGGTNHYKHERWKQKTTIGKIVVSGMGFYLLLKGTIFVKYLGTCVGSQQISKNVDRSNKFYYLGLGCLNIQESVTIGGIVEALSSKLYETNNEYMLQKYTLLTLKLCNPRSMYDYILLYTIGLNLPSAVSEAIATFIGDLSICYVQSINRFCKIADHHTASMVCHQKERLRDFEAHLVFDRKTYMRDMIQNARIEVDESLTTQKTLGSIASSIEDIGLKAHLAFVGMADDVKVFVGIIVLRSKSLNNDIMEQIASYLADMEVFIYQSSILAPIFGMEHLRQCLPSSWNLISRVIK